MTPPKSARSDAPAPNHSAVKVGDADFGFKDDVPFQVQVRTACLSCGKGVDDELCVGPYLAYLVVEFDPEEFRSDPLSDGNVEFNPARLPSVFDSEDNEIPEHPVLQVMRGKWQQCLNHCRPGNENPSCTTHGEDPTEGR